MVQAFLLEEQATRLPTIRDEVHRLCSRPPHWARKESPHRCQREAAAALYSLPPRADFH
jgi:hypothetical protein